MNYLLITYAAYLIISIVLTIWVGRTLYTNGKVFLMDIFSSDPTIVDSVNKLLLIGFYLINFGWAITNLIVRQSIRTATESVEMLSTKIGIIIITLGVMHFMNILILFRMRWKSKLSPARTLTSN